MNFITCTNKAKLYKWVWEDKNIHTLRWQLIRIVSLINQPRGPRMTSIRENLC